MSAAHPGALVENRDEDVRVCWRGSYRVDSLPNGRLAMPEPRDKFIPALCFKQLTPLFDPVVAMMTRERTFKRRVLDRAGLRGEEQVLDLACGTGTLAIAAARAAPGVRVAGVDTDPVVLAKAQTKADRSRGRSGHIR